MTSDFKHQSAQQQFRYVPRALLLILRLHLGVILIITVLGKILRSEGFSVEMLGFLNGYVIRNSSQWYQHFLQQVVIPRPTLFFGAYAKHTNTERKTFQRVCD